MDADLIKSFSKEIVIGLSLLVWSIAVFFKGKQSGKHKEQKRALKSQIQEKDKIIKRDREIQNSEEEIREIYDEAKSNIDFVDHS